MYTKIKRLLFTTLLVFLLPVVAFAVTAPTNFKEFAALVVNILRNVAAVLFASLAIGLLYGVVLYLASSPSEKRRSEIKEMLLWGVIGIIVVMGIWGILGLFSQSLFGSGTVGIPQLSPPTS